MSIGFAQAARRFGARVEVALAVDFDRNVLEIFKRNVLASRTEAADVALLFDGNSGAQLTVREQAIAKESGDVDVLLGGPPCQGHSDLNNHTRRRDPKNALYLRMARAAEVLKPRIVVVENVVTVQRDKSDVVDDTIAALRAAGYEVAADVIDLQLVGVPQRRRRFVLVASRVPAAAPSTILTTLTASWKTHQARSVRWAIEDLLNVDSKARFDTASARSPENVRRMAFLFEKGIYNLPNDQRPDCHRDGDHSYQSVYGRLRWDRPAPTITTGFGSMGQGRYVHPQRRRTITPHEAARLQTFPDWFDFGASTQRGILAKAIGNAVPPFLTLELGALVIPALIAGSQDARAGAGSLASADAVSL